MDEFEIFAYFDIEETTIDVAKLMSYWFTWLLNDSQGGNSEIFSDMGLDIEDYQLEGEEIVWDEAPNIEVNGNCLHITLSEETVNLSDIIHEILENLGAQEINEKSDEY